MKFQSACGVYRIVLVALCLASPMFAGAESGPIVGQVVTSASIDGVTVPGGTALLNGSRLTTLGHRVSVQLTTGQVVEVGRQSSAVFQRNEGGEVKLTVHSGRATVRETTGELATLLPDDTVTFSQRQTGEPIQAQEKVVAVLAQPVDSGENELRVLDAARIEPTDGVLIRSRDGLLQDVTCRIERIDNQTITLSNDVHLDFKPDDLLIQRLRVPESKAYTRTTGHASSGTRMLNVEDSKVINPLEHLVVRSPDGRVREVACIDYTHEEVSDDPNPQVLRSVVRVAADLDHNFPAGSELWQGQNSSSQEDVTTLSESANSGQRALKVAEPQKIDPLQQLMIVSPDGQLFESYCIYSIVDDRIRLAENLDHDYPAGSRIVQGRSARQLIASGTALQRTANCCCCCQQVWVAGGAWWWWVVGGGAAAGVTTAIVNNDDTTAPPPTGGGGIDTASPVAPRRKRP